MRGAQHWRSLLFVHWRVPVAEVRPLIPTGLELDTYEGDAFVGLVLFTMPMVKPFVPFPGAFAFHETNVRTYVRRNGRPGVWFFSLDAASSLAVRAARFVFHLPYFRADMELVQRGDEISYHSERRWPPPTPATCRVRCRIGENIGVAAAGTLEHFLVERYTLYSASPKGAILRGEVEHVPYPLRRAEVLELDESLLAAAGIRRPDEVVSPVLFSDGVDVEVRGPYRD